MAVASRERHIRVMCHTGEVLKNKKEMIKQALLCWYVDFSGGGGGEEKNEKKKRKDAA